MSQDGAVYVVFFSYYIIETKKVKLSYYTYNTLSDVILFILLYMFFAFVNDLKHEFCFYIMSKMISNSLGYEA